MDDVISIESFIGEYGSVLFSVYNSSSLTYKFDNDSHPLSIHHSCGSYDYGYVIWSTVYDNDDNALRSEEHECYFWVKYLYHGYVHRKLILHNFMRIFTGGNSLMA